MVDDKLNCPKCGQPMEEGFVPDHSYAAVCQQEWAQGQPKKTWLGSLSLKNTKRLTIQTYRCTACGYLESYAKRPVM